MAGRNTRSSYSRAPGPAFISQTSQQPYGVAQNQGNNFQDSRSNQNSYNNRSFANNQQGTPDVKPIIKTQPQFAQATPEPTNPIDTVMDTVKSEESDDKRMPWRKGSIHKVKKLSNSERRGRQNKKLRKLLTPKNALMILNELNPQVPEYKMAPATVQPYLGGNHYKAEVVINGSVYHGQGLSKILAKNNAAEKAIRDLVLERMRNEKNREMDGEDVVMADEAEKAPNKESQIPMIHLASYALHKLFTEWQAEGYEIPLLTKNLSTSNINLAEMKVDGAEVPTQKKQPKQKTELPANAADLHPAMLLSQMRPGCQYSDISQEGTAPNNIVFTIGVIVDGEQFLGSAKNKKEARRQAAMQACSKVFGIKYPTPQPIVEQALPITSVV